MTTPPTAPQPATDYKGRCMKCGKQLGTSTVCDCAPQPAPPKCVCGDPTTPNVVHRTDGPCYHQPDAVTRLQHHIVASHPSPSGEKQPEAGNDMTTAESQIHAIIKAVSPEIAAMRNNPSWHPSMYQSRYDDVAKILALPPPPCVPTGEDGPALIAAERKRQVEVEKWDEGHDNEHEEFELTKAAISYACHVCDTELPHLIWPWHVEWWKPSKDPVRNLVKAGALLAAEIDRLQRAATRGGKNE